MLLLVALLAGPPAPTATPASFAPVELGATATTGQTRTLADVARERKGKTKSKGGFSAVEIAGPSPTPEADASGHILKRKPAATADAARAAPPAESKPESYWREKAGALRTKLEAAERVEKQKRDELASLESRIAYSPIMHSEERRSVTVPLRREIESAQFEAEGCRRQLEQLAQDCEKSTGCWAGWLK